jgi:hypothetical protein
MRNDTTAAMGEVGNFRRAAPFSHARSRASLPI